MFVNASLSSPQIPSDFHYLVPNSSFPSNILRDVKRPNVSGKIVDSKRFKEFATYTLEPLAEFKTCGDDKLFCIPQRRDGIGRFHLHKEIINKARQILFILYKTPLSPDVISIIMRSVITDINFKYAVLPELQRNIRMTFQFHDPAEADELNNTSSDDDSSDEEWEDDERDDSLDLICNMCKDIGKDYYAITDKLRMPHLKYYRYRKEHSDKLVRTESLTYIIESFGGLEIRLFTKYHKELILKKLKNEGLEGLHTYNKDFDIDHFKEDFKDYQKLCKEAGVDKEVYEALIMNAINHGEYIIQAWWSHRYASMGGSNFCESDWDDGNDRLTIDIPHGHYGVNDDKHLKYHIQYYNNQFYIQKDLMSATYGARKYKCIDVWTYEEPEEVVEVEEEPEWKSYTPIWVLKDRIRPNAPIGDNNWFLSMMNNGKMGNNKYNPHGDYIIQNY